MKNLAELTNEIGEWSKNNFGGNEYTLIGPGHKPYIHEPRIVFMNSYCALMGITEEIGELCNAIDLRDEAETKDALADVGIYMCDYAYRSGIKFKPEILGEARRDLSHLMGIVSANGRLYHAHLKQIQGIRGMAYPEKFSNARQAALNQLAYHLVWYSQTALGISWVETVNETWDKIVSKRNWKTNAQTGGQPNDPSDPETS